MISPTIKLKLQVLPCFFLKVKLTKYCTVSGSRFHFQHAAARDRITTTYWKLWMPLAATKPEIHAPICYHSLSVAYFHSKSKACSSFMMEANEERECNEFFCFSGTFWTCFIILRKKKVYGSSWRQYLAVSTFVPSVSGWSYSSEFYSLIAPPRIHQVHQGTNCPYSDCEVHILLLLNISIKGLRVDGYAVPSKCSPKDLYSL